MSSQYSADALKRSTAIRRRATQDAAAPARPEAATHPLLRLQQQIGNSQVARMLAQRDHLPEEEEPVQANHDPALLQRQPDQEEEEIQARHDAGLAQRQAEEEEELQARHDLSLMRQTEEEPVQASHEPGMAMRQPDQEEEEEPVQARHEAAPSQRQPDQEEEEIQAKPEVGLEGGPLSEELASRIQAKRGSGAPLDSSTRTTMESAFGASFEDVRVHTDAESDALNRRISAKAFTTGSDIFFRQGVYDPSSSTGRELLSHELTHVVQQRSMTVGSPMTVNPAGDRYEQEADAVASQVSRLVGSGEAQREMDEAGLQRQPMAPEEEEERRG
jgi:hypothetical protein